MLYMLSSSVTGHTFGVWLYTDKASVIDFKYKQLTLRNRFGQTLKNFKMKVRICQESFKSWDNYKRNAKMSQVFIIDQFLDNINIVKIVIW